MGLSPPQYHLLEASTFVDPTYSEVDALFGFAAHSEQQPADQAVVDSAPIPKQSRMLPDAKGKLIYIGQSASLSYLHIVQRVAADCIGSCKFTDDPQQQYILEKDFTGHLGSCPEPEPELERSLGLAEQYELAVSGVFNFFDISYLQTAIPPWVADPNRRERPETPVIFLALAIGALGRAADDEDEDIAERYFNYGRQQAVIHLMDDPCLMTVVAFSLISYYMLSSCRRNGAFTNIGIAARAAYALGIHRHETNRAFGGGARERAWKSLRVCDLFLSASMGRPPATSEADCNIPWSKSFARMNNDDYKDDRSVPTQEDSAIFRICLIFERILVEVFSRRAVSLDLAGSISQQHRQWTEELPSMLKIDGLLRNDTSTKASIQKLGTHIVTMAYYYSITLLCRPFLSFHVGTRLKKNGNTQDHKSYSDFIATYSDACIDSAIKGIALAHEIVFDESMPKRQPLIINSVFISALCLGHAIFGDYDQRGWPLNCNLDTAISILRKLGPKNPQAARYCEICCYMKEAVGTYTHRRADTLLRSPNLNVRSMFGDIQAIRIRTPDLLKDVDAVHDRGTEHISITNSHTSTAQNKTIAYNENTVNNIAGSTIIPQSSMGTPESLMHLASLPHDDNDLHEAMNKHYDPCSNIDSGSSPTMNNFAFSNTLPLFSLIDDISPSLGADHSVLLGYI
ncbi:C6 transcription factor, putative [Talaromyces marneffei ATCC 18224]|uniref:C6 transcription factor, putative n=1 Tax=Talaromyces marneffei (strain ATCC 18224 / CBS 334.59 / QM 7333) TaxID=441960 RepID=B6QBF9_TALMQ|nr:C6 transcription factor, putative [Talaromyces marneffei ATCC 18224]